MKNYIKILSFSSILIFSLLLVSCDYIEKEPSDISFKGEEITNQVSKSSSLNGNNSEVYLINTKSSKAKELQNQIKHHLQKGNSSKTSKASTDESVQKPNLDEARIVENNDINKGYIVVPINTGSKTSKKRSVIGYNNETNSISEKTFFYKTTLNLPESEISALKKNPDHQQLPSNTTYEIEITDQVGNVLYKERYSKSEKTHKADTSEDQINDFNFGACYENIKNELEEERTSGQQMMCDFGLSCDTIEGAEAVAKCTELMLKYE